MDLPTTWKREGDIDVLYLGEIAVGRVCDRAGKGNKCGWIFHLAGHLAFWKNEKTEDHARLALTLALSDWLRRAGLKEPTQ